MAVGPTYDPDPFDDADFEDPPRILNLAYPSQGRVEVSLLFSSSLIDKYSSHLGGLLQVDYNFTDTLGAMLTFGFLHGSLTSIVTDDAGIIGNKVSKCIGDATQCDVNPDVPDYSQLTGVANLAFVWSPLYGKVNVVSELDANLQAFVLAGAGVVGTREIAATVDSAPSRPSDYTLSGGDPFEGGVFSNPKVHGTVGIGLQVFFAGFLALRADVRGIIFPDEFDFDSGQRDGPKTRVYASQYWFTSFGLGFVLF
jgi:outer membrane beta-barrel protein